MLTYDPITQQLPPGEIPGIPTPKYPEPPPTGDPRRLPPVYDPRRWGSVRVPPPNPVAPRRPVNTPLQPPREYFPTYPGTQGPTNVGGWDYGDWARNLSLLGTQTAPLSAADMSYIRSALTHAGWGGGSDQQAAWAWLNTATPDTRPDLRQRVQNALPVTQGQEGWPTLARRQQMANPENLAASLMGMGMTREQASQYLSNSPFVRQLAGSIGTPPLAGGGLNIGSGIRLPVRQTLDWMQNNSQYLPLIRGLMQFSGYNPAEEFSRFQNMLPRGEVAAPTRIL